MFQTFNVVNSLPFITRDVICDAWFCFNTPHPLQLHEKKEDGQIFRHKKSTKTRIVERAQNADDMYSTIVEIGCSQTSKSNAEHESQHKRRAYEPFAAKIDVLVL